YMIDSKVEESTDLVGEFGFDSLTMMELAKAIEKRIGVVFSKGEAATWTTIRSILCSIRDAA
ncbi:MAG: hypothetical protein GF344_13270, partial [Chitinivibrionales bacterium]|nr:hypothetical protein [Chitinivibrionales bacterium]